MKNQELKGEKQMIQDKISKSKWNNKKMKRLKEHGVTLVALVVTIIIMLILAGVAIRLALGENGLFSMSRNATGKYKEAQTNEEQELQAVEKELEKLTNGSGLSLKVQVGDKTEEITKDNFGKYLGMEVTNFKEAGNGIEEVEITDAQVDDESGKVKVSTKYRLYYVDFDNKYGDGAGTIYLKADCTENYYKLTLDETNADEDTVKIKQLNPSLYMDKDKNKLTAPNAGNNNMKAVTWLLNTEKWAKLKDTVKQEIKDKNQINYIVGAPSLEMMMDSYNTHYGLTGDTPVPGAVESAGDTRKKLFYKYEGTSSTSTNGYKVGPGTNEEYYVVTANCTVKSDSDIDSMYYPGVERTYRLASPCVNNSDDVSFVNPYNGGYVCISAFYNVSAFCPLVSLKSSFNMQLKGTVTD